MANMNKLLQKQQHVLQLNLKKHIQSRKLFLMQKINNNKYY